MKHILKNNNHGKEIYVIYDDINETYSKISFENIYQPILKNEIKGINWYNSIHHKINITYSYFSNIYSKIETKKIYAYKFNYFERITENYEAINNFIDYYCLSYPCNKNNEAPIHGDLTLDNILYGSDSTITIIDWENFNSNYHTWGYDLVYLIISSFFLPMLTGSKIREKDIKNFIEIWQKLKKINISNEIMSDPINYFINKGINNKKINKNYKKFFFNIISDDQIKLFNKIINYA